MVLPQVVKDVARPAPSHLFLTGSAEVVPVLQRCHFYYPTAAVNKNPLDCHVKTQGGI
jgi:hypothetical protein